MKDNSLTIVIISYNTCELTLKCLDTLHNNTISTPHKIIVFDNNSSDQSTIAIKKFFPSITLIESDENIGFARANNLVAKDVSTEWMLLLNPDTEVYSGAIDNLLSFALQYPKAGIYGGRTVFPDGSLNIASCWNQITPWSAFCHAVGLSTILPKSSLFNPEALGGWERDTVRTVDIVVGCFLLIRKGVWDKLEGFDPRYVMYGEESDLCLRAAELGYQPMISPDATIMHLVGASSTTSLDKTLLVAKARTTLIRNHWPRHLVSLGVAMMWLWAANRYFVSKLILRNDIASHTDKKLKWASIWRDRHDWIRGYE